MIITSGFCLLLLLRKLCLKLGDEFILRGEGVLLEDVKAQEDVFVESGVAFHNACVEPHGAVMPVFFGMLFEGGRTLFHDDDAKDKFTIDLLSYIAI